jgi:CRISPR-associated protein Cmr6
MPILQETKDAVGANLARCDSRSLVLERFADPTLKGDERRAFFGRAIGKRAEPYKRDAWRDFLLTGLGLKADDLLFAQLQSRLMVNMAGGVMENAGLCLDRLTGIPYIPGSAVKGCARRMAIQELFESSAGFQPANGAEDLTARSRRFNDCASRLTQIARVFGWVDQDWKTGSDFEYACGEADWDEIRERAAELLFAAFPCWKKPADNNPLWQALPSYAGSVSFLPSYPIQAPNPDLELDVVTCHHREYYNEPDRVKKPREWEEWNRKWSTAPDTEEPNPVVFPAVATGHVFVMAVVPLRGCNDELLKQARQWLKQGLETFGLGAKVAAGYGWFNCSDSVQQAARTAVAEAEQRRQKEQLRKEEDQRRRAEKEERRRKAEEMKKLTASMTPEQKADYELAQLTDDQFRGRLLDFLKRQESEQKAIVRALRLAPDQRDSRRKFWDDLKQKTQKGGKPAQIEQAIRQLSKQMFPGKEGKMP